MPSAIIEAAEAERARLKEEWDLFVAQHEYKLEQLDTIEQAAGVLAGDPDPGAIAADAVELERPAESADPPPARKKPSPTKPRRARKAPDLDTRSVRKTAILECLTDHAPNLVPSAIVRDYLGGADKKTIRSLLDELIDEGKAVKEGERAGTRYGLANPEADRKEATGGGTLLDSVLKRRNAVLSAIAEAYPAWVRTAEISKKIGMDPVEIRKYLSDLVEDGEVLKEGYKYSIKDGGPVGADGGQAAPLRTKKPAAKPKTFTNDELDAAVMKELREEDAPMGQPTIAMRLKAPPNDVMASLNRLANKQLVHKVRQPGGISCWEPTS